MTNTGLTTRRLATVALVLTSTAFAILLAEVGLRFALNPGDFLQVTLVDDSALGHRIESFSTGHDALGYRNSDVPPQADIVAIGDSMTYGVSASREGSWPQQLSRLLGERVYNMALGGYGPLQYLHLAKTSAPSLKPRLLIVGFYFGNDLMDSFNLSHARPHWHGWRLSNDGNATSTKFDTEGDAEPQKRFGVLRNWLAHHSLLYSVLKATVLQRFAANEQDGMAKQAGADTRMLWKDPVDPKVRTIFTPKHRLRVVDMDLAAVGEGFQISKRAFAELKNVAQRQNAGLLVVLIPTKERTYCQYLARSKNNLAATFTKLCDAEAKAGVAMSRFLRSQGIEYVDVWPALEARVERHEQIYPPGPDGHPQAEGYAAIAEAVATAVQQRFPRR